MAGRFVPTVRADPPGQTWEGRAAQGRGGAGPHEGPRPPGVAGDLRAPS